jgi:hypothetical protein
MLKKLMKLLSRTQDTVCYKPSIPAPEVQSLGWVNVFVNDMGRIRVSCHPYKSKKHALLMCKKHPTNKYLRTVEIQELLC